MRSIYFHFQHGSVPIEILNSLYITYHVKPLQLLLIPPALPLLPPPRTVTLSPWLPLVVLTALDSDHSVPLWHP